MGRDFDSWVRKKKVPVRVAINFVKAGQRSLTNNFTFEQRYHSAVPPSMVFLGSSRVAILSMGLSCYNTESWEPLLSRLTVFIVPKCSRD